MFHAIGPLPRPGRTRDRLPAPGIAGAKDPVKSGKRQGQVALDPPETPLTEAKKERSSFWIILFKIGRENM